MTLQGVFGAVQLDLLKRLQDRDRDERSRGDRGPDSLKAVLPEEVVEILLKTLAYDPRDRYRSVRALEIQLGQIRYELLAHIA